MTIQELEKLLKNREGQNLEFKAKSSFSDDDLFDYCAALANEGGGFLIFGIDNTNRSVVGTNLFHSTLQTYPGRILNAIDVRVKAEELSHPKGRVVIFQIPSRPKGRPVQSRGKYTYPMRAGESLMEMDQETLRIIFIEVDDDYSSKIVSDFSLNDLDQRALGEAVLNAITHRDYTVVSQSVFIKANPSYLLVVSPGGFLPGITPDNVLEKQAWRNRRIAEVFQKIGLVERSGQGMDQIFESTIRDGKGVPDLSASDSSQVALKIPARVQDKNFILFLEKIGREKQITFSFPEIYQLELLREKRSLSELNFKERFLELGIIEKIGRTSGIKYMLAHRYYEYEERPGLYTRIKGLSREHKKELILEHIQREGKGVKKDFKDAFPDLKTSDISNFLQELKSDGKIKRIGSDRAGYWKLVEN